MIKTFTALLAYECLGELIAYVASIPIPGAVIGMLLLLGSLAMSPRFASTIEGDSLALLKLLPLLFVPAGVGVMVVADRIVREMLPIALSILVSTALTIIVTGLVGRVLSDLSASAIPVSTPQAAGGEESFKPDVSGAGSESKAGTP